MSETVKLVRREDGNREAKLLLLDCRLAEHTTLADVRYAVREGLLDVVEDEFPRARPGRKKATSDAKEE